MNTMRSPVIVFCLCLVLQSVSVTRGGDELDALPYGDTGPLRVYVEAGWKGELPIAENMANPASTTKVLELQAYITNRGQAPVLVALGLGGQVGDVRMGERLLVSKIVRAALGPDGVVLKPSSEELSLVSLAPGEMCELPFMRVSVPDGSSVRKIEFVYSVDNDLAKWYELWTGKVTVPIDVVVPAR